MADYDVLIIGSGHNGLTCACYLAKAGLSVLVLERRPVVGGAVCTEEIFPGYRIDVGSSAHIMIHLTPVVRDLELEKFGLEYISCDPWAFAPFDNGQSICFYNDVDRTCESIARISPHDADAYRAFVARWMPLNEAVFKSFLHPPTLPNLMRAVVGGQFGGRDQADILRQLFGPYGRLLREQFVSPQVRASLAWLAAQSGPPPSELASGDLAGWNVMIHQKGLKRPRGGSGMLTQAMARCLEHDGGVVRTASPVGRILIEHGRAIGVRLQDGSEIRARAVVSNAHVQTTFLRLIAAQDLPGDLGARVSEIRVGNGFGMIVRCAVSELPNYLSLPTPDGQPNDSHRGMQLICPTMEFLEQSYADYVAGEPSRHPPVVAMSFSAVDDTLAPPGKHILYLWGQYHPYALADGQSWAAIREREADKLIAQVAHFAPNVPGSILDRFIQTPLDIEERIGMLRGNVMHVEMSFDQMFLFRPLPELSSYRTPLHALYLTGASTHPGGGVFAASGHNTAQVVLKDWSKLRAASSKKPVKRGAG